MQMGIFYNIKIQNDSSKLIKFTRFFIVFNYSIYVLFVFSLLLLSLRFTLSAYFIAIVVGLFAILRSVLLFRLKYANKKYLKDGSMFSISRPLSIKILSKK